ncbi:MAG: alpha/beta hydrolase [Lachnospiraceae bacterium]|nr:alpha/beta hydrolase [Lachnospiraceae bacterium]
MAVQIETVKTAESEMRYFRFGEGTKNMVILPGLSLQDLMPMADTIADAYSLFTEDFTVWFFDRRTDIPEGYTIEAMAEDTARAMKKLGLKDIYLFGVSQGGMIAQCIAAAYTGLVCRMVLASTASRTDEGSISTVCGRWKELAGECSGAELFCAFAKDIYTPSFYEAYKDAIMSAGEKITEEELDRFRKLLAAVGGFNISGKLTLINCPVLVLGAAQDTVTDAGRMAETAQELGWESFIYEGYGHAVYDEAPDFKERILGFFQS